MGVETLPDTTEELLGLESPEEKKRGFDGVRCALGTISQANGKAPETIADRLVHDFNFGYKYEPHHVVLVLAEEKIRLGVGKSLISPSVEIRLYLELLDLVRREANGDNKEGSETLAAAISSQVDTILQAQIEDGKEYRHSLDRREMVEAGLRKVKRSERVQREPIEGIPEIQSAIGRGVAVAQGERGARFATSLWHILTGAQSEFPNDAKDRIFVAMGKERVPAIGTVALEDQLVFYARSHKNDDRDEALADLWYVAEELYVQIILAGNSQDSVVNLQGLRKGLWTRVYNRATSTTSR